MTVLLLAALLAFVSIGPGRCAPLVALPVRVVTVYHAVPAETDGNPLVTADGTQVSGAAQRICAVSQDLLVPEGPLDFGDWLWVDLPDKVLAGAWQVHDTVAAGYIGYVDLLVPPSVNACWRTADAVVKHPGGCPPGATVYQVGERGHR